MCALFRRLRGPRHPEWIPVINNSNRLLLYEEWIHIYYGYVPRSRLGGNNWMSCLWSREAILRIFRVKRALFSFEVFCSPSSSCQLLSWLCFISCCFVSLEESQWEEKSQNNLRVKPFFHNKQICIVFIIIFFVPTAEGLKIHSLSFYI